MSASGMGDQSMGVIPSRSGAVAILLALLGVGVAWAIAPFADGKPLAVAAFAVFPIVLIVLLNLPLLGCLRPGPRALLVLLALRPLVDASSSVRRVGSGLSLQDAFAVIFGFLLLAVWMGTRRRGQYTRLPNLFLFVLVGLAVLAWATGGVGAGTTGFARTVWGLSVALLFGSLFTTEQQTDIFVRVTFYSSVLFLLVLSANTGATFQEGNFVRLGGQYTFGAALAAVTLSFFVYGLYVLGRARSTLDRVVSLTLLALLGVVIVLTQERTPGGVMLILVCVYLWATKQRWLLFGAVVPLLVFLFVSSAATGWRLISSFSIGKGHVSASVLTLTGRTFLWAEMLKGYVNADVLHKIVGLGWGTVYRNFAALNFVGASVTENSFLWFLLGTGILGLLAFSLYLFWVLSRAWKKWWHPSGNFERQLGLLAFLSALTFIIEGFTNDLALSPNANVYLYAAMSIFVFQWLRNSKRRSWSQTALEFRSSPE